MKEKLKVPKLRFREFDDEWEIKSLEKVLKERKIRKNISEETPLLAFAAGQGVIDRSERKTNNRDFLTKDSTQKKYLLTKYDDIVYNPSNLKYGAIDRNKHGQGVISPIYVTFETTEIPCFIELIVKSEKFKQRALQYEEGTVTKRQSVKPENLLCLNIVTPSLPEQQKIADFLSKVDEKIEKLTKKKELLEQYKKGVMQKIFSQEIRFKDDNGKEFPEWEEKEVEEIFNTISTKEYQIKASEIVENGLFPVIDQGQKLVAGYCNDKQKLFFEELPVIIYGDHTTIIKYINYDFVIGADGTKILKNKIDGNLKFLYYSLCYNNIEPEGYKRHFSIIRKVLLNLPSLPEQQKIAYFLSSLDKKIDIALQELGQVQEFKKGLLQQMFV